MPNIVEQPSNDHEADPVLGRRPRSPGSFEEGSEQVKRAKGGEDPDRQALARMVVLDEHAAQQVDLDDQSQSSSSDSDDSVGVEPPIHPQPEALLITLSKYSNQPALLHVKIIEHAAGFMHQDVLRKLQTGQYDWMSKAFLKTRADSTMSQETMLGLMMAMMALQGAVAGHVATFVSDLDPGVRKMVLGLFQSELAQIFPSAEVCRWLAAHPK